MVCVFARKTSEPLASLVKKIDEKIGENNKLKAFVVVLTERTDKTTAAELKKLAEDAGIKNVPLTLHQDPGRAGRLRDRQGRGHHGHDVEGIKVKANHAFKGELTDEDIQAIVADIPKVLSD